MFLLVNLPSPLSIPQEAEPAGAGGCWVECSSTPLYLLILYLTEGWESCESVTHKHGSEVSVPNCSVDLSIHGAVCGAEVADRFLIAPFFLSVQPFCHIFPKPCAYRSKNCDPHLHLLIGGNLQWLKWRKKKPKERSFNLLSKESNVYITYLQLLS